MTETLRSSAAIVTKSERDTRWFLQSLVDVVASGEETGGAYAIFELLGPAGDEVPVHVHTDEDEAFLILEGEVTAWVGDAEGRVLAPGDYALMPRNVPHCYTVTSDIPARWLGITSPAGFEGFVREVSTPAAERRIPDAVAPTPDGLAAMGAIAKKYGVTFLGRPGQRPAEIEK